LSAVVSANALLRGPLWWWKWWEEGVARGEEERSWPSSRPRLGEWEQMSAPRDRCTWKRAAAGEGAQAWMSLRRNDAGEGAEWRWVGRIEPRPWITGSEEKLWLRMAVGGAFGSGGRCCAPSKIRGVMLILPPKLPPPLAPVNGPAPIRGGRASVGEGDPTHASNGVQICPGSAERSAAGEAVSFSAGGRAWPRCSRCSACIEFWRW